MERKIRCLAIDDEPIALSVISQFCKRLGHIELETYSDPQAGLDAIMEKNPDVVLLDIEMRDMNGLGIAKKIGDKTIFIFTTAYLKYALDGFDLDAVDFLHKPFAFGRFRIAMERAERRLEYKEAAGAKNSTIIVRQEYANVSIRVNDIEYIGAMENYAKIYKLSGECIISHTSMKALMDILPAGLFIRVHRSYIIPSKHVKSYTRQEITLASGRILPVGRQYADSVMSALSSR